MISYEYDMNILEFGENLYEANCLDYFDRALKWKKKIIALAIGSDVSDIFLNNKKTVISLRAERHLADIYLAYTIWGRKKCSCHNGFGQI